MKARKLGSAERAHRPHCVRRRRATFANRNRRRPRTSETNATSEASSRRYSVYLGFPVRIFLGVVAHPSRRERDFKVPDTSG